MNYIFFLSNFLLSLETNRDFLNDSVVKNLPANEGDAGETGSILGLESSLEVGNGNPPQHSCLEDPMDRGAWRATVHRVEKSGT